MLGMHTRKILGSFYELTNKWGISLPGSTWGRGRSLAPPAAGLHAFTARGQDYLAVHGDVAGL